MDPQLSNPFRKPEGGGGGRRTPPEGVTSRDWAKLYIMALVFLMVVGAAIYLRKVAVSKPKPKADPTRPDFSVRPDRPPPKDPADPASPDEAQEPPPRKDIPIPPLPKDGVPDFRELASPFRDGAEKPVKETPEFLALLNVMMNAVSSESLAKRVNPDLSAELAYLDPAKHRGEVLRSYGRLIYIYTERIDSTTPNNVEFVYLGILQEFPKNRTVYFYLPELPKDPKTGNPVRFESYQKRGQEFYSDWVEVEGVFLRRYDYPSQYQTEKGEEIQARSAVLFAKNLRIVSKPEMKNTRAGFVVVVAVVSVVLVAIVLVAGIMTRKYGGTDLRIQMHKLRKEKGKAPASGPPLLGDEVPKPAEPVPAAAPPAPGSSPPAGSGPPKDAAPPA